MEKIKCARCGQYKEAHPVDTHLCIDCHNAENSRITYYRQHQRDWLTEAKEQGLDAWLQQPGETQWEYSVWVAYRDSYPGKKPSYGDVARQLKTSNNAVRKIAQRWNFQARMQIWMAECDRVTMLQRRDEILNMNKEHINMATTLRSKLNTAIESIVPERLKPGEIASLAKLSTELERKARIDEIAQDEMRKELLVDNENPELKTKKIKQSDLGEVVQILLKSGALESITAVGVRETTTTTREVVAKSDESQLSDKDYEN